MNKIVKSVLATGAAALSLGGIAAVGVESAVPQKAEAFYITIKVSPSSEKSIRVSDLSGGRGFEKTVSPGHYSPIAVQSFRIEAGCEGWKSGVRIAKRQDKTRWYSFSQVPHSSATLALRNCRNTGRGDIAPA